MRYLLICSKRGKTGPFTEARRGIYRGEETHEEEEVWGKGEDVCVGHVEYMPFKSTCYLILRVFPHAQVNRYSVNIWMHDLNSHKNSSLKTDLYV